VLLERDEGTQAVQPVSDLEDLGTETVPLTAVDISTPPSHSTGLDDSGGSPAVTMVACPGAARNCFVVNAPRDRDQ